RGWHVVRRGEQHEAVELLGDLARDGIDRAHALDLVAEELNAYPPLLVCGEHLDRVAPHPELVPDKSLVVALVLQLHEATQDRPLVPLLPNIEDEALLLVHLGRTEPVD